MSNCTKLKTQNSKVKTKALNVKTFCHPDPPAGGE